jgi:GAF domain-containing protein
MAFRTKLILLLAGLLLAQGLYLGTLTLSQSRESLRAALQRGAAQIALRMADEIARIVGTADKILELKARELAEEIPGSDPARLRPALRALDETHLTLERLLVVDRTGHVVAASFTGAPASVAEDPALRLALDADAIGPLLTRDRGSSRPILRIARPIRTAGGEVVGALLGTLELTEVADAMRGVSIGKTGSLYLVDREGEILAAADQNPPAERGLHLEAAREAARLVLRGVRELEIPGQEPLIGAYAAVVGTGWTLAVQQTAGEAYLPAARLQRRIVLATGLAVLVAALVAGGLGTWLTRPIRRLTARVRAVTRPEDLGEGFPVPGSDEVAQLAAALTRMAELILTRDREIRQRNRELEAVNTVITAVSRTPNLDRILETALETVTSILEVDACQFRVLDPATDELTLRAHRGRGERFVRERARIRWQDSPLAREAASRGEYISIPDITADPRGGELYAREEGLRAFAIFALMGETGPVGLLCVYRRESRPFTPQELLLLSVLGGQVGVAIDTARLYGDLQASTTRLADTNRRLAELYRLTIALQEAIPLPARLDLILEGAHEVLGLDRIGIFLPDPEGTHLQCRAMLGVAEDPLEALRVPVAAEGGVLALAYREARDVVWEGPGPVPSEYRMPGPSAAIRSFRSRAFAVLPLLSRGRAIGVLVADNKVSRRPLPRETVDLLRVFSQQAAIALENAQLFTEAQDRAEQISAANRIASTISSSLHLSQVFDIAAEETAKLLPFDRMSIALVDEGGEAVATLMVKGVGPPAGTEGTTRPLAGSAVASALATGEPCFRQDTLAVPEGERFAEDGSLAEAGLRSWVAIPLQAKDRALGTFNLCSARPGTFTRRELPVLLPIARQLAIAIENARLFEEARATGERLRRLTELSRAVTASLDAQAVLESIVRASVELFRADAATLAVVDPATGLLTQRADYGLRLGAKRHTRTFRPGEGVSGRLLEARAPLVVEDFRTDPRVVNREWAAAEGVVAYAGVPLLLGDRAVGTLAVFTRTPRRFDAGELDLLASLGSHAAIALENARLYAELKGSTEHLEESRRNLEELHRLSIAIQEAASLEERLGHVLRGAHEILALDWINIFLPDEGRTSLRCVARVGGGEEPLESLAVPLGPAGGGLARAFLEKEDVCWNGEGPVPEGIRLHPPYADLKALRARIFANIPLVARGEAIGVIAAGNPETRRPIPEETRSFLRIFAAHAAIAIENARLYRSLKEHSATLEQRIAERTKELAEASRQKSRFLASMSHELRTPLNAILGFSEVLLDRYVGDLTQKQVEYLESIHASGKHLLGLINDLLDLSKIEAGKMVLHPEPCYLPQTLEDALTLVRSEAIRKRLELSLEVASEVGLVEADPAKLKQILYNLLSNAIKFTPERGRVTLRGRQGGSLVEVEVADTGIGIRPEDQGRIFGEFEQVDSAYARQVQGTGLGLPLTRRLVELHGGTLTLQSAEGQGSTFTFTLPLRVPQAARA